MSSIPGAFFSDEDDLPSDTEPTLASMFAAEYDAMDTEEDDSEFHPESDIDFGHGDGGLEDEDDDSDDPATVIVEEDEEEEEETEDGPPAGAPEDGGSLRIAFDAQSRRVLILDSSGNATALTEQHLAGTSLTMASIRQLLAQRFGGGGGGGARGGRRGRGADDEDEDEDEEDEDDEDDDDDDYSYWGRPKKPKQHYPVPTEPVEAGVRLERSGEFGSPPKKYEAQSGKRKFIDYSPNLAHKFRHRELNFRRSPKSDLSRVLVPNSPGVEVAQFQSSVYSGQYSTDGNFFYAACKDFRIYIYDTSSAPRVGSKSVMDDSATAAAREQGGRRSGMYAAPWHQRSSMKLNKVVKANEIACRWTITDANLSADNDWMLYSSITPYVHLVKTGKGWDGDDQDQEMLDFANGRHGSFGIWSVRFSHDAREAIAGASDGQMFVHDLETKRTVVRVRAHSDDVNAVAFADKASSNLLLSGSDDHFVKVWDRRSLSDQRASGTLVGHTEGVTFVAPKGDGRYCLSNGKDQGAKLWDLRMMTSQEDFSRLRLDRVSYGIPSFDYRQSMYPKPKHLVHPHDNSVMTYRGHAVMRTLIRCHFSPSATTDQQYVYSGSSDGKVHIWSLDGLLVSSLDRRSTHPLINQVTGDYNDPLSPTLRAAPPASASTTGRRSWASSFLVRDVSWHPYRPELMSTAWCEQRGGVEGNVAMHAWRGATVGEKLEDRVQREEAEASG